MALACLHAALSAWLPFLGSVLPLPGLCGFLWDCPRIPTVGGSEESLVGSLLCFFLFWGGGEDRPSGSWCEKVK